MTGHMCPCSLRHSPPISPAVLDGHHSPPRSWPLAPGVTTRHVVQLCANAHRLAHDCLELWRRAGGEPSHAALNHFPPICRDLAAQSWADADHSAPLPRTVAGP